LKESEAAEGEGAAKMASASSGPSAAGVSSLDPAVPSGASSSASGIKRSMACEVPYASGMPIKKIGHRGVDSSGETTYKKVCLGGTLSFYSRRG